MNLQTILIYLTLLAAVLDRYNLHLRGWYEFSNRILTF